MTHLPPISIGMHLRTNRNQVITVQSISSKSQHRKAGYHAPNEPCHMRYVRLAQCTEIVPIPSSDLTPGYYLCRINNIPYTPFLVLRYDGEFWLQYCCLPNYRGWIGVDFDFDPLTKVAPEP